MSNCVLRAENFDKNGNRVPSKLFDQLEEYFGTLRDAWKYYDLSRQPEFRQLNPSVVQYDEFGDMTFQSFLKASQLDADEVKLINMLNKELQSGEYPVREAIEKVGAFNRVNSREDYIGTLRFNEKGNAEIEVVRNTYDNRMQLKNTIQSMQFFERMQYKLAQLGIGIKLIDNSIIRGKYDTTTTKRLEDAINYLISVSNGEQVQMDKTLAREIGHLIQASMRHNPLMERIDTLLTDDVIKSIFGEDFLSQENYRKEALGHLIGDELYRNQTQGGLKNLLNRLFGALKRVWAKVTHNDVMLAHEEARSAAISLVKQFLEEDYSLDEDSIFEERELLYDRDSSKGNCEEMFRDCLITLSKLRDTYRAINPKLSYSFFKSRAVAEGGRLREEQLGLGEALYSSSMLEGVFTSLKELATYHSAMVETIAEVGISLKSSVTSEALNPRVAQRIREVAAYVTQVTELVELLQSNLQNISNEHSDAVKNINSVINQFEKSLKGYIDDNNIRIPGLVDAIKKYEQEYALRFLEQIYGKDYIKSAKRRIWGNKLSLKSEAVDLTLKELMEVLNDDISLFGRFVTNAANSGDIITGIIDKQIKAVDTASNDAIMNIWHTLKGLRARTAEILGTNDTSIFYERDSNGVVTGNFISEDGYCWGQFYADKKVFMDEGKKNFREWLESQTVKYSETEAEVLWSKARRKLEHEWKKTHMITVDDKLIPIDSYKNTQYQELMQKHPELEPIYRETMGLYKSIINNMLGEKMMPHRRAPQIRGSIQSAIVEQMKETNPLSATFSVLTRRLMSAFVKNNEDQDFGGTFTYNSVEEDPAFSAIVYEQEYIERAPLYFINPLQNKSDLRTDMFGSIEAFTVMAAKYKAMQSIVDSVEVVREQMLERKDAHKNKLEKNLPNVTKSSKSFWKSSYGGHSRAYTRLCKYIDMQVYNNYFNIDASKHQLITALVKGIMNLSTLGSRIFLASNTYGAMANVGTGAIEVFKEAMTNDVIKLDTYGKAHALYLKEVGKCILDYGNEYKSNKMDLFLAMLDTQHGLANEASNWHPGATLGKDALNIKSNIFARIMRIPFDFMVMYKAGDHYMQAIPYLSIALDQMFINPSTGERCNMYEVFDCVPIDDRNPSIGNKLVFREGFIKEEQLSDIDTYDKINKILSIVRLEDDAAIAQINANQDYKDLLYKEKLLPNGAQLTRANIHQLNRDLTLKKNQFGLSLSDLSDIRNVAREMTIRMHGIYNNMDKTAFHGSLGGALMSAMKGYAFGMILRRFGPNVYNVLLDRNVEGTLNTMSKIAADFILHGNHRSVYQEHGKRSILEVILDVAHFAKLAVYPFSKEEQKLLKDLGYDEWQVANTIRNFGDYMMIGLFKFLEFVLEGIRDEDKQNLWIGNALYFVTRLGAEQQAFNSPRAFFMRELPSVINPDRSVGWSFTKQLYENLYYMTVGAIFDLDEAHYQRNQYSKKNPKFDLGYKEGENKGWHWVERYAPISFGFLPNPWLRWQHVWYDPERARETYLFSKQYGSK